MTACKHTPDNNKLTDCTETAGQAVVLVSETSAHANTGICRHGLEEALSRKKYGLVDVVIIKSNGSKRG